MTDPRLQQADGVVTEAVDGSLMLLAADGQEALLLNETAAFLWQLLTSPRTPPELTQALANEHPTVPKTQVTTDVAATLELLLRHRVIIDVT